jgi:hypothetical protein
MDPEGHKSADRKGIPESCPYWVFAAGRGASEGSKATLER